MPYIYNTGGGVVLIERAGNLFLEYSRVSGVRWTGGNFCGLGIRNNGGGLSLLGSDVSDNLVPDGLEAARHDLENRIYAGTPESYFYNRGGGICNLGGQVNIVNSTIRDNAATRGGGGISNDLGGTVVILNSSITGNWAAGAYYTRNNANPFGIYGLGGGILNTGSASSVRITQSTLMNNYAVSAGAGIANGLPNMVGTSYGQDQGGTIQIQGSILEQNLSPAHLLLL